MLADALNLSPNESAPLFRAARTLDADEILRATPLAAAALALSSPGRSAPPLPLTLFVGREGEVAKLVELVRRPTVRLVTVTGPGGVGKTRLVVQAVQALRDDFPSIVYVSLAPVRDPALLFPTVAQHLNVPDAPAMPLMERLRAFLADQQLLLVLDNLEHLLEAVPAMADLLAGCPRLTILCTCRTNLNLSGEHRVPLAPLPADEARMLFLARVQALAPDYALTDPLLPVADAICARLDRLPLAIELAAARVPTIAPRALLARLEHRLDLLTDGPRDLPPRLRSLRDTIAWSYELLPRDQQRLFRHLGLFIGGFTLAAAEAVPDYGGETFAALSNLVAASLVILITGRDDEPRYTMLETIREFALERLRAAGEEPAGRWRHADYYRGLAEETLPSLDGPEVREAIARIDLELDNCRAAMSWTLEQSADPRVAETGVRLVGALWRIWRFVPGGDQKLTRDRLAEGLAWIERMLPLRDGMPVEAITEALLAATGFTYALRDDFERSQALAEELLTRARAEGYPYGEYWAIYALGALARVRGDLAAARRFFSQARDLAPAIRNPDNHVAIALHDLGEVDLLAGDPAAATRHWEEALRISQGTGNTWVIGTVAAEMGRGLFTQGQLALAARRLRQGVCAFANLGRGNDVHAALVDLARVALASDAPVRAARLLGLAETFPYYQSFQSYHTEGKERVAGDVQARLGEAAFTVAVEDGHHFVWSEALAEIDSLIGMLGDAVASAPPSSLPMD
jgi:predicted ATPase